LLTLGNYRTIIYSLTTRTPRRQEQKEYLQHHTKLPN
jgi:hypothetical protein